VRTTARLADTDDSPSALQVKFTTRKTAREPSSERERKAIQLTRACAGLRYAGPIALAPSLDRASDIAVVNGEPLIAANLRHQLVALPFPPALGEGGGSEQRPADQ
jgi:hypothetical protein